MLGEGIHECWVVVWMHVGCMLGEGVGACWVDVGCRSGYTLGGGVGAYWVDGGWRSRCIFPSTVNPEVRQGWETGGH